MLVLYYSNSMSCRDCVSKKFFERILAHERTSIYRLDWIGSHQCQPDIVIYLVLRLEYILSQEDSCVIAGTDNITPLKRVVVQLALLSQREIQSIGSSITTCEYLLASKKAD